MKRKLQENTWKSDFGNTYTDRNLGDDRINITGYDLIKNKINLKSAIEFGSNIGLNLDALKIIYPGIKTFGIEINKRAFNLLKKKHEGTNCSIIDYNENKKYDLSLICGVLIHQKPKNLKKIYSKLFNSSSKYIYIREYFNDKPVALDYRGKKDLLFKRDFALDLISLYPNLKLVDYGFHWKHDKLKKCDNENWFLFSK